ncbi:ATP-binding cassette domain-containing protein [Kribbella sp. NBC_00889]|uniref:ATP-binding cassette domain-containing protein n=1 Tax=Kribbella sp. NBC_00889 TaxID=2975974 RepID=UPI003867CB7E
MATRTIEDGAASWTVSPSTTQWRRPTCARSCTSSATTTAPAPTANALELAERMGLDLDHPMAQLCCGQLRRLGIVQALMHQPDLIVLDDPCLSW